MIAFARSSDAAGAAPHGLSGYRLAWIGLALAGPTALYFTLLAGQTVNVPLGDDYVSLLPFLTSWHATNSVGGKLSLLWEQYFSHRIVCTRLAAVMVDTLHGDLQLVWLKVLGWGGWCALLVSLVFARNTRKPSPLMALSAALLLMLPQGASNMLIAMQAIQHVGALLFALWTFQLLAGRSLVAFGGAITLAVGATLSSANGLFVFPIATLLLWLSRQRQRAIIFALLGVVTWAAFFFGYRLESHPFSLLEFLTNIAALLGGWATLGRYGLAVAVPVGAVTGALAGWIIARRPHWQASPSGMAFLLYLLLSVAMVARARIGWTADYMLQDRYRIYGMLVVAGGGLFLSTACDSARRRIWTGAFLTLSTVTSVASYTVAYPSVLLVGEWSRATAMNRQLGRLYLQPGSEEIWAVAAGNLLRAEQAGVYQPPQFLSPSDLSLIQSLHDPITGRSLRFKAVRSIGDQGYVLAAYSDPATLPPPEFVVAVFPEGPLLLAIGRARLPFPQVIARRQLLSNRFVCIIPFANYHQGTIPVYGLSRDATGQLHQLWSATAQCP